MPSSFPLFHPAHKPPLLPMQPDLVDHLASWNNSVGNPLSASLVQRLKTGASLIIAGQQPGLLLGPLYTFWKLLTAVLMARDLTADGHDTIPAFWIASEDHDILEVNRMSIGSAQFVAEPPFAIRSGQMPPVGTVSLIEHRDALLAFLRSHLGDQPHADWVCQMVAQADFASYSRFFATLASALFADMEVLLVDALSIRPWTAPVLADLVDRFDAVQRAVTTGAETLRSHGFQPPLSDAGVFEIRHEPQLARVKCAYSDGQFALQQGRVTCREAAQVIGENPDQFSTGAALRPVVQDAVLPVRALVGGPSELLYLWQINGIYDVMDLRRSELYPRISATVLPSGIERRLKAAGGWQSVLTDHPETSVAIDETDLNAIETRASKLMEAIGALTDMDVRLQTRAMNSIEHQTTKVLTHVRKQRVQRSDSGQKHRQFLRQRIMPGGIPQERQLNLLEILAQWGPDWLHHIQNGVSPWEIVHRFITIP